MKHAIFTLLFGFVLFPAGAFAQQTNASRLSAALTAQTARVLGADLSKPDAYGTPYVLRLVRQGDTKTLRQAVQNVSDGSFLLVKDAYGNNIFHVAKDATTVQAVAALVRQFYGPQTAHIIRTLTDEKNRLGETPLMAQINAGHGDTFLPLYAHTTLKVKNDMVQNRLARLHGSDPRIVQQNRAIYCTDIIRLSSANARTLLQAAQDQVPYHPHMSKVVQNIQQMIPCLVQK